MFKVRFLFLALLFISPLAATPDPVRNHCIRIFERLVVEFPADEAAMWKCIDAEQKGDGDSFEVWKHVRTDADERIVVVTTPWECGIQKSLDEVVGELIAPYKKLPLGEKVEIEKIFGENEAWVIAKVENSFVFYYRIITTPFGVHIASFTHQSNDSSLVDLERARKILQEYCYLVY